MSRSPLDLALDRRAYQTDGGCHAGAVLSVAGLSAQSRAVERRVRRARLGVAPVHGGATVPCDGCGARVWSPSVEALRACPRCEAAS